ncbi:MAG TPA: SDR family NAD(P)-dependent oxidoreductase [Geminicoccus sp.]|jgi:short-subunit dehydrogenase|uniref:SDR family NAD(P)-dependent oxidoreductase n=1 Tax=Geminicoccus sp. TaxID=2024832 RepID=UPI002E304B7B|nr:SDR family NAD(P)-dependent oxidoreductase [Geminicoccus sp.]HEX2526490.1 SDR family NAD(P)-dependent oxidoreductase [Geminicoccus sp.]
MSETWLILGGSSGLARAIAREVAGRGHGVLLAGRDLDDLERSAADLRARFGVPAHVVAFDADKCQSHAGFVSEVAELASGPLTLVLAFAVMTPQAEAERDPAQALAMIDIGYRGAVSVLLHFIPLFEARRTGRVVVIGSVAGDRGRRSNYVYGSVKAGLATFTEGLRARLLAAGIPVTLIKPGFLDTTMTWPMKGGPLMAAPADAAKAIVTAAKKGRYVAYVPFVWWGIMQIIKWIPTGIMKRLSF